MQINPMLNIDFSLPLPIYKSIHIADAISKDGENFSVFVGLDEKMAAELKKLSLDKSDNEIQQNTSDLKRFGEGSYEEWYKKNRTPFILVHRATNALAGLIWFGPEPLFGEVGNWHTAGWRSYKPFRGKGLMKDFCSFAFDIYLTKFSNIKFWITAKKENTGSIKLAENLGFKISEKYSDGASVVMVKVGVEMAPI